MATVVDINSEASPDEKTPRGWHKYWSKEMSAAEKRLRDFTKEGNEVNAIYLDEDSHQYEDVRSRLNLFYTNVATTQAMLYGNTPQIDVSREHADPDDDIARVASVLYERMLQNGDAQEPLAAALKHALQDRLIPGLGTARVRYTFESEKISAINPETMEVEEQEQTTNEDVPVDYVHWQDFRWGWARTWKEMPWMAYRSYLDKETVKKRFGEKVAENLEYKNQLPSGQSKDDATYDADQENNIQKAEIWEIWCKKTGKVYWWSYGADLILDVKDDPLELEGFWPSPRPMAANLTTSLFVPKSDYLMHQDLYRETDVLYARIVIITRAVKVVGVYDKSATDSVGRMLKEGVENDLIPVDNWAMFGEKGGLQGTIDWFPVQEVVGVLATLQQALGSTIELLSQTTGMSDLLRGANTDQYTSDGTNQLTAKFGSIRIQELQDEFARFASDLQALKAEVIGKHYSPQSILQQSNAQFMPEADRDKVMPAVQLMQSPDIKWRVDIRPESLAMIDYAQLKQERTEFLNAMATYIQSAQAAVKQIPGSLPVMLEMLKWGMAGFKGSDMLEGTMDAAIEAAKKAPPPGQDDGKQQQQMMQMQMQMEMQKIQAKAQADMQVAQAKMQGELQKIQMDNQATMQEQQQKANGDLQKITADLQADLQVIRAKLESDVAREQTQSTMQDAENAAQHGYSMTEAAAEHQYNMIEIDEQNENREGDE